MQVLVVFLLGLAIGSFLNVLIDRLPQDEDVVHGRSHCDYCKKTLRWFELIPLLSFIIQGGKCRRCHKRLSFQYPLIEAVTGLMYVLVFRQLSADIPQLIGALAFASAFLVLFVTDVKEQIIPDSMLVLSLIGLGPYLFMLPYPELVQHAEAAVLSVLGFYLLYRITKRKGMGFGDVKLVGVMGLLLGYPGIVIALYVAFLTGALCGVILMIGKRAGMKSKIAFGPFLVLGTIVALVWSQHIVAWWMRML